jgi:WD40 repeat protein
LLLATLAMLLVSPVCAEEAKRDRFGDPLPAGAIARLGTTRAHVDAEAIAFSADGTTLISTSRHAVRHWDTKTGRVLRLIERPAPAEAWGQIISADGRTAAVLWHDRLEIRDVATDRLRQRVAIPPYDAVSDFVISSQGNLVVVSLQTRGSAGSITFAVRTDAAKIDRWPDGTLFLATFSPNADRVGSTEVVDGKRLVCCRDASGKILFRLPFDGRVVAFSADGATMLVHDTDKKRLVLVDAVKGAIRDSRLPEIPTNPIAVFSPDGRWLAVETSGGGITLWDINDGKALHHWDASARRLAFSPDGKRLAGADGLLRCWDVESGKSLWPDFGPLLSPDLNHGELISRPAGNRIATWDSGTLRVRVWDWTTGQPIFAAPVVGDHCEALWLTPDGSRLHVCTHKRLHGWDLATGKELPSFTPIPTQLVDDWYVMSARESADGRSFTVILSPLRGNVVAAKRMEIVHWEAASGKLLEHRSVEFNFPAYARTAAGGQHFSDREQLLNALSGRRQTVAAIPTGFELESHLEFSRDGRLAFSHERPDIADDATELVVWEVATGRPLFRRPVGLRQIVPVVLSPDNRWLALPAKQSIELWDLATGQRAAELPYHTPEFLPDPVSYCVGLTFLPSRRLLAAYGNRIALVWQLPPETEKSPPQRMNERTWDDLASAEPRVAQDAVWALVNDPAKAIALLCERLKPAAAIADAALAPLLVDLAGDNFARRDAAFRRLRDLGHVVEKPLEAALPRATNSEQTRRLKALLDECRDDGLMNADERRALRAIQALGQIGTPAAGALLESWSKGADAAILTREAKAALERMR